MQKMYHIRWRIIFTRRKTCELPEDGQDLRPKYVGAIINKYNIVQQVCIQYCVKLVFLFSLNVRYIMLSPKRQLTELYFVMEAIPLCENIELYTYLFIYTSIHNNNPQ
jgi:hypothetical protein